MNKVIIVTGASKGIGKEIAKKLSKDYEILKVTNWKECKNIIDNVDEQ